MISWNIVASIVVALAIFSVIRAIAKGIYKTLTTPGED